LIIISGFNKLLRTTAEVGSRIPPISPVDLIARLIEKLMPLPHGRGHPPLATEDVVATLFFFLREGVQWRVLRAAPSRVSGATLWRHLVAWTSTGVLQQLQARLIRMVRGGPSARLAAL
jgi:transposase